MEGPRIDWSVVEYESDKGYLIKLLKTLPREHWRVCDKDGRSLLHYACRGPNANAITMLLTTKSATVHDCDIYEIRPIDVALAYCQASVIEILLAAGAQLQAVHCERAVRRIGSGEPRAPHVVRTLCANGMRLNANITPEMRRFEAGVLRCRTAVVALLRVKQAGNLVRWDRFLLRELAYALWSTRWEQGLASEKAFLR